MDATWKLADALTLIDEVHSNLGDAAFSADNTVGQAKVLWQENRGGDALNLLLNLADDNRSTLAF